MLLLWVFLAIAFIILAGSVFKLHPFLSLFLAALGLGLAAGLPALKVLEAVGSGFGGLLGAIGPVVVLGSIIGVALEQSGAAMRLADLVLSWVGPRRPVLAMTLMGAVIGVPVFCDSGFMLLSGLQRALSRRTGIAAPALALGLASGLYATHTLVPPTPGPIAAIGNLGASEHLGLVMILGLLTAIPISLVGAWLARQLGSSVVVPSSEEEADSSPEPAWPGAFRSLAPIVVPVLLIALGSVASLLKWGGAFGEAVRFFGHPLPALALGTGLALWLLPAGKSTAAGKWVEEGIKLAGPILIITGMGGAFGQVLKAASLSSLLEQWMGQGTFSGGFILVLGFLLAALLKTAQGSTTSALVVASAILAPLLPGVGFDAPVELATLVLALGGGAMTVSHANDSFFWVVTQFGGIPMREAFRTYTLMTGALGLLSLGMALFLFFVLGAF